MQSSRESVNRYLYCEFGLDANEPQRAPSADWPFDLEHVGDIVTVEGQYRVFHFIADEPYYALDGPVVQYFPVCGMTLEELRMQLLGEHWLRLQEPVGLDTTVLGDDAVPGLQERRLAVQRVADCLPGFPSIGLFLKKSRQYVVVARRDGDRALFLIGPSSATEEAPCPEAPDYRRLTTGLGELIARGAIE